ncbi:uncharacterized protein LOC117305081 [Asterias rubens]|uniref:uncharacterized protein LOC117305081 n=1 Tax=Asterias rubens TaxID=7604 RepID=UPI00145537B0|nr:uncharacterized protein LOC117305081 [Asterias rubens]
MNLTLLLPSVLISIICNGVIASTSISTVGEGATTSDNAQALYPRYPACRRGREFAIQVPDNERVEGRYYYERRRSDGQMRYYLCLPCTVCEEQGLVTAAPCTERSDTRCSQDCIVPGCLFDVSRNTCVASVGFDLPVDPEVVGNDGRSVCHAPVTSEQPVVKNYKSMAPDKGSTEVNIITSHPKVYKTDQAINGERDLPPALSTRRHNSPQEQGFIWTASEALFGGIAIVSAVVIANVCAILYIRRKNKETAKKRKRAVSTDSSLHAAMARARSDSNVDGKNKDAVFV